MRPLSLELEGFTCFKQRQNPLDLDGLDLFAISGPTGAGKSSLLDAMIFALFGKVPRLRQGLGELISLGSERAAVRLDFALAERRFRIFRALHHKRSTSAQLDEQVDGVYVSLSEGVRETDRHIQELLGLDYETFIRAVILPQGDFAAFLKSSPAKQREMLRKLLRLDVYEDMRALARRRAQELATRLNEGERRLQEDYADATAERLESEGRRLERLQQQLVADGENLSQRRDAVETLRRLQATWRTLRQHRAEAESAETAWATRQEAHQRAQQALVAARKAADGLNGLRRQGRQLDRRLALLEPWRQAVSRLEDLASRQVAQWAKLQALEKQRGELLPRLRSTRDEAIQLDADLAELGFDAPRDALLAGLRDTALGLRHQRQEGEALARQVDSVQVPLRQAEQELQAARRAESQQAESLKDAEGRHDAARAELRQAEGHQQVELLRRPLQSGDACPVCGQEVQEPPSTDPDPHDLEALRTQCEALRREEDARRDDLGAAQRRVAAAEGTLEVRRQALREVQGRLAVSATEVGRLAAELHETLGGDRVTGHGTLGGNLSSDDSQSVEDSESRGEQGSLWTQWEVPTSEVPASDLLGDRGEPIEERLLEEAEVLAESRQRHQDLESQRRRLELRLAEVEGQAERQSVEIAGLQELLDELDSRLQAARQEVETLRGELGDIDSGDDLEAQRRQLDRTVADLEQRLDTASTEERQLAVELATAAQQRQQAQDAVAVASDALAALHGDAEDVSEVDDEHVAAEEAELAQLEADQRRCRDEVATLGATVQDLERRHQRRRQLDTEIDGLRRDHDAFQELQRELAGQRFQAFLLEKVFDDLVRGATVRLLELSQQRYELAFEAGVFVVVDHDNAGQRRSADTLSGGETFLASLSLALELCEQVQREAGAITLESLFIDEGFGTLDPETLETVAGAIEALPHGGRTVGIITHLPELTERLPWRVMVTRHPSGSTYHIEEA